MNNEKFILQEEIKRMRELTTYDKSKTLNEQGSADINMDRVNQQQLAQAPESTVDGNAWIEEFYPKVSNSYQYVRTTFSGKPALKYDYNPNSTIIYTQNRWYQYPKGVTKGEPTIKGSWKLDGNKIVAVKDAAYNKPVVQEPAKTAQVKTQTSVTDQNIINNLTFDYTYPGDTKFVYANQDGTWYGKNSTTNKVYNISKNYPANAKNLESGAVKAQTQTTADVSGEEQTTPNATAPKKLTDMSSIELSIMKKNQPLDYKSAYDKLGAIEKKMVDDKAAGK